MFFISYTTAQFLHSDWWIALSIYDVTLPDQPAVCLFFPPLWTMSNRPLTEFSTPRSSLLHNPLLFEELLILASWKVTYLVYLFFFALQRQLWIVWGRGMDDIRPVSGAPAHGLVPLFPPGLQAIYGECRRLYPDQANPLQVTAIVKYWYVTKHIVIFLAKLF